MWLQDRKLAGILIETASVGDVRYAVIGIGINIAVRDGAGLRTPPAALCELLPKRLLMRLLHWRALRPPWCRPCSVLRVMVLCRCARPFMPAMRWLVVNWSAAMVLPAQPAA